MVGMIATIHSAKELELDMGQIVKSHFAYEIRECRGKYAVVELLADGTEIWYTGFPNRTTAERFLVVQPGYWGKT